MHTHQSELDTLIQSLDKAIPNRDWLKFLELTSRTGVADTRQLQLHLGWTRGIFSRRAEKLLISTLNGEPLVSQIDRTIKRPTEANRPPAILRLEKGGAQLLRSMGYEGARASELKDDLPILHALGMVTLSQVLQKDASVIIDQVIRFGEDRHIRPDIVVVPGWGSGGSMSSSRKPVRSWRRGSWKVFPTRRLSFSAAMRPSIQPMYAWW